MLGRTIQSQSQLSTDESKTEEKDVMVKVVVNLINQRNY